MQLDAYLDSFYTCLPYYVLPRYAGCLSRNVLIVNYIPEIFTYATFPHIPHAESWPKTCSS